MLTDTLPFQVAPEVDANLQSQLEEMGFSANKAVRALHFTGTGSLEQAVNWLVEHGEDADIDSLLLVPKVIIWQMTSDSAVIYTYLGSKDRAWGGRRHRHAAAGARGACLAAERLRA